MADTNLPPGVNHVGDAAPAPAQNATPATPATEFHADSPGFNQSQPQAKAPAKWNLLEIAAGVVLLTASLFLINYLRRQTHQQSDDSKEKDMKIKVLQSDMSKIKQTLSGQAA